MDMLIQQGIYTLIFIGLIVLAFGGVIIKHKFNIKDSDIEFSGKIIGLLSNIIKNTNFKFSGDVEKVAHYVLEAIDFVQEIDNTVILKVKKDLVVKKAAEICNENGITVDDSLVEAINVIVDYFVKE